MKASFSRGEVGAVELTELYLAKIAADQDKKNQRAINAFLYVDAKQALLQAANSDARRARHESASDIDGWPIAIKDNIDVAGMPTTAGIAVNRNRLAEKDSDCVARLRAAGAVLLGKVSLNEGALGADNRNPHFGDCNNPLRHGFTAGGSSGGSAAAVAAGFCFAALGTDTMGSVRIPAAYCGVVGFKPSYASISRTGLVTACARLDHVGILSPDVETATKMFAQMRQCSELPSHFSPQFIRLGVLANLASHGVNPDVIARFEEAVARLGESDFLVSSITVDQLDFGQARRAGLLATEADMALVHAGYFAELSPHLQAMLNFAKAKSALDLAMAYQRMERASQQLMDCFSACDFLLTPTTPQRAFALGQTAPANQADLTSLANMAGCPALSLPLLPLDTASDTLPFAIQIIAPPGRDDRLLALASLLTPIVRSSVR